MKTLLVLISLLLSLQSFAQTSPKEKCYETAKSQALYYAVQEDYVLTANEFEEQFGLIDVAIEKEIEYWSFGDGSLNIFLSLEANGPYCKLLEISSGQDDQD